MNNVLKEFEKILKSEGHEEQLQKFLYENSFILAEFGYGVKKIFPKPSFGSEFKADFALVGWGNYECWTFVEIEKSSHKLFTKEGLPTQALNRAIKQVNDWWIWLYDYGEYAKDHYKDISGDKNALIVIGRRSSLNESDIKRLQSLNSIQLGGKLKIVTYDALLDYTRSLSDTEISFLKEKTKKFNEFKTPKEFRLSQKF